jgi:ubiquinone/menaquinone biosynthesis C-methylase UbiE
MGLTEDQVRKILNGIECGQRCLEIGAGYGRLLSHMIPHFGLVVGVDSSEKLVAQSSAYLLSNEPNCRVVLTDGEFLPFPDNSFNFVYSFTVFQHMTTLATIRNNIREAHRVLAPNGVCRVQTVCGDPNPDVYDGRVFPSISEFAEEFLSAGFISADGSTDDVVKNWIWVTARK